MWKTDFHESFERRMVQMAVDNAAEKANQLEEPNRGARRRKVGRQSPKSGRGGGRTRTRVTSHGILSPVRLPIPPLGLTQEARNLDRPKSDETNCERKPDEAATFEAASF